MKGYLRLAVLVGIFSAHSLSAQEPVDTASRTTVDEVQQILERSGIERAIDSIAAESAPELEEALEQLTTTLNDLAERVANDPELRASALRTAEGMLGLAQIVVAEQSEVLLDVLRTASERISATTRPEELEPSVR